MGLGLRGRLSLLWCSPAGVVQGTAQPWSMLKAVHGSDVVEERAEVHGRFREVGGATKVVREIRVFMAWQRSQQEHRLQPGSTHARLAPLAVFPGIHRELQLASP